jgi:hypothetical protein
MNLVALEFNYKIQTRFGFINDVLTENTTEIWNIVAMQPVSGNYVCESVDKTVTLWKCPVQILAETPGILIYYMTFLSPP